MDSSSILLTSLLPWIRQSRVTFFIVTLICLVFWPLIFSAFDTSKFLLLENNFFLTHQWLPYYPAMATLGLFIFIYSLIKLK